MKVTIKLLFIACCLLMGLVGLYRSQALFTAETLVESILLAGSILYIGLKYTTSRLIQATNRSTANISKMQRITRSIIVAINMQVILPACLAMLYGCFALYWVKFLPSRLLSSLPGYVYDCYEFSETRLKYPVLIITLILGVFAAVRFLSIRFFKQYKRAVEWASFPFVLASTLVLFIHADTGVKSTAIRWKIQSQKPVFAKTEALSFDSGKNLALADKIVTEYIKLQLQQLEREEFGPSDTVMPGVPLFSEVYPRFYESVRYLQDLHHQNQGLEQDLLSGLAGVQHEFSDQDRAELREIATPYAGGQPQAAEIFDATMSKDESELKAILKTLADEQESLGTEPLDPRVDILKDQLKEVINTFAFDGKLKVPIPAFGLVTDNGTELLSEQLANGLLYLVKQRKVIAAQVRDLSRYLAARTRDLYRSVRSRYFATTELAIETGRMAEASLARQKQDLAIMFHPMDADKMTAFVHDFPHYSDIDFIQENIPIAAYKEGNEEAIQSFNADFFRTRAMLAGPAERQMLLSEVGKYEAVQRQVTLRVDTRMANDAETSTALQNLLQQYPNHPQRGQIRMAIQRLQEKEAFEDAYADEDPGKWTAFFDRYGHNKYYQELKRRADEEPQSAPNFGKPDFSNPDIPKPRDVNINPYDEYRLHSPIPGETWRLEFKPIVIEESPGFWEELWGAFEHSHFRIP